MIAMALICNPKLLIADEPTTALDVTVQAQILELIKDLQREFNSAVILITHDLGVVAETCDAVLVMYGGQCVEMGTVDEIFYHPEMPYTWGLLGSMPRMDRTRQARLQPIAGPTTVADPGAERAASSTRGAGSSTTYQETRAGRFARISSRGRQSPGAVSHRLG